MCTAIPNRGSWATPTSLVCKCFEAVTGITVPDGIFTGYHWSDMWFHVWDYVLCHIFRKCLCINWSDHMHTCGHIQKHNCDLIAWNCMSSWNWYTVYHMWLDASSKCSMVSQAWGFPMIFIAEEVSHISIWVWLERQNEVCDECHILSLDTNVFFLQIWSVCKGKNVLAWDCVRYRDEGVLESLGFVFNM